MSKYVYLFLTLMYIYHFIYQKIICLSFLKVSHERYVLLNFHEATARQRAFKTKHIFTENNNYE